MVGNERRKKEAVSRGGRRGRRGRRERGRREGKENGRKKDVGFDVKAERILESSQNEVRPHEPYINQPRLLSLLPFPSSLPLLPRASLKMALFIFALAAPLPHSSALLPALRSLMVGGCLPRGPRGTILSGAHIKRF